VELLERLTQQSGYVHLADVELFCDLGLSLVAVEAQEDDLPLSFRECVEQWGDAVASLDELEPVVHRAELFLESSPGRVVGTARCVETGR
jgi:hypothetical protein